MADTPQNMSGVSTPPDSAIVADNPDTSATITGPNANDQTVPQTAAASTPPPTHPQPGPTSGPAPAPAPGQPQAPTALIGKPPVPGQQPTTSTTPTPAPDPRVAQASKMYDVAEALAGGKRYAYNVDAYGEMKQTQVPVSGKHLALAIAMEALQGAITGAANGQGPNGLAKAAQAGMAQGQKQQQDQEAKQRQQATEDYARHAQVLETNMRMRMNAQQIGRGDAEDTDNYVAQYKPILQTLQERAPGYIQGPVKYSDFAKYNVTKENAIPYMRVPRLGADGKQTTDAYGVKQWDVDYYIVKPGVKLDNLLSPADLKTAKDMGLSWANNPNVLSSPMDISNILNIKSQMGTWNTMSAFNDAIFKKSDQAAPGAHANIPTTAPEIKNPDLSKWADQYSAKYNVPAEFTKTIMTNESNGNPNAVSPTGVAGPMQVTQNTAKAMGLDRDVPEQNVEAGVKYFSKLLTDPVLNPKQDPRLAAAMYYSGPKAVKDGQVVNVKHDIGPDTNTYVANFVKTSGLGEQSADGGNAAVKTPDRLTMAQWQAKNPSTVKDFEKFSGALNGLQGDQINMIGAALAHLSSSGNPDAASNIAAFYNQGNPDFIKNHDNDLQVENQTRKDQVTTDALEQRTENKTKLDEEVQAKKGAMIDSMLQTKIPDNFLKMSDQDAVNALHSAGVTVPSDALIDVKAIANMDAPLSIASNKRWFKDAKMDQGELEAMVRMVNPGYDTRNFDYLRAANMPNSTENKTIISASQLANHLNTLQGIVNDQAASKTPIPALNKMLQSIGYQTGGTQLTDVQTMANIVTSELGKTLAGGFAPDKEQIQNIIKTMNPANATQQMNQIIGLYVNAMHGKIAPIDDEYNQKSGAADKHFVVPKSVTSIFQANGYDTPWDKTHPTGMGGGGQQMLPGQKTPNELPVRVNGQVIGFSIPGKQGYRPLQTQQPTQQQQPSQQGNVG